MSTSPAVDAPETLRDDAEARQGAPADERKSSYFASGEADTGTEGAGDMAQEQVEGKLDLEITSEESQIHYFAEAGDVEGVRRCLLADYNVNEADELGCTPVHLAGAMGHINVVKLLVEEHGAAVDAQDGALCTSLHAASEGGHPVMVALLLRLGAAIDSRNGKRQTPLHYACGYGQVDAAQQLVLHGASPGARDVQGNTPLHLACSGGSEDVVRMLLCQGSSVDALNHRGRCPIHLACRSGHLDIVTTLLENGANPSARDANGMQAANMIGAKVAVSQGVRLDILKALERSQLGEYAMNRAPITSTSSVRQMWMERENSVARAAGPEDRAGVAASLRGDMARSVSHAAGSPHWEVGTAVAGRLEEMRARELGASLRAKVQENEAMRRYLDSVKEEMRMLQMKLSKQTLQQQQQSSSVGATGATGRGEGGGSGGGGEGLGAPADPWSPVGDTPPDEERGSIAERVARGMYGSQGFGGHQGHFAEEHPSGSLQAVRQAVSGPMNRAWTGAETGRGGVPYEAAGAQPRSQYGGTHEEGAEAAAIPKKAGEGTATAPLSREMVEGTALGRPAPAPTSDEVGAGGVDVREVLVGEGARSALGRPASVPRRGDSGANGMGVGDVFIGEGAVSALGRPAPAPGRDPRASGVDMGDVFVDEGAMSALGRPAPAPTGGDPGAGGAGMGNVFVSEGGMPALGRPAPGGDPGVDGVGIGDVFMSEGGMSALGRPAPAPALAGEEAGAGGGSMGEVLVGKGAVSARHVAAPSHGGAEKEGVGGGVVLSPGATSADAGTSAGAAASSSGAKADPPRERSSPVPMSQLLMRKRAQLQNLLDNQPAPAPA